jgi:hypothetical protein
MSVPPVVPNVAENNMADAVRAYLLEQGASQP